MRITPQAIINSRLGIGLALGLARGLPPHAGYRVAYAVAGWIARQRDWDIVQAARANQWVVSGGSLSEEQLDRAVEETFRNTAHCIYDLYHNINNDAALWDQIDFGPAILEIIQKSQKREEGLIIVGMHSCSFDIVMQAAGLRGLQALVITLPQLTRGYRWQTEMRARVGLEIVPASVASLHEAVHRLRNGETVLTGLDRPLPGLKHRSRFFGRPALLPVHHIQLALKTKVPVVVASALLRPDGIYTFLVSDPLYMRNHSDRETEIRINSEAALKVAEEMICQDPHQWAMFHPVWPEALEEVN
jgi:KDO2-lipid IV(A) lauroyltransferase